MISTLVSIGYVRHSYMSSTFAHCMTYRSPEMHHAEKWYLSLSHCEHAVNVHYVLVLTFTLVGLHEAPQVRAHRNGLM